MRTEKGPTILMPTEGLRIPGTVRDLESFRRWVRSGAFPERGRIDWIAGEMEIDMEAEDAYTHGTPKVALTGDLREIVEKGDVGVIFSDSMRLSVPSADLSVEPDVVVLLFESLDLGRVKMVPKATREAGRFTEISGAADIIVECVSDSSEEKDMVRLRERYFRAGVREYWIVDARGASTSLTILSRGRRAYRETPAGSNGFTPSVVLGRAVRLVRLPPRSGVVRYSLESRPL